MLSLGITYLKKQKKMNSKVAKEKDGSYTFSMNVNFSGGMLEKEEQIQSLVNQLGLSASALALKEFDTDGSPTYHKGKKLTSRGLEKKTFKHPMDKSQCIVMSINLVVVERVTYLWRVLLA